MDILSLVSDSLRHADTLYYLLQRKQHDYEENGGSAASKERPWNCASAEELRCLLSDVERRLCVQHHTSGKRLQGCVSTDLFNAIVYNLNAVKIYLYSVVNMSSPYFRVDDKTPGMMQTQINDIKRILNVVKEKITSCGLAADVVENVTTAFTKNITELSAIFQSDSENSFRDMPHPIRRNLDVFRRVVQLADNLRNNKCDVNPIPEGQVSSDNNDGAGSSSSCRNLFGPIPGAAKELTNELTRPGVENQPYYKVLQQVVSLWGAWQIERNAISYDLDQWEERLLLGHGASSVVYSGSLTTRGTGRLPVAVKNKSMAEGMPDTLRDVFLHLLTQHNRIAMLYGMWYPGLGARQSLIVFELLSGTLASALKRNDCEVDKVSVLRDTAAGLAHMHERGIVHCDVRAEKILVNDEGTRAKLSDFGLLHCRSINTVTSSSMQQVGLTFNMAPEAWENAKCRATPKMDCWAFGILVCEVMNPAGRDAFVAESHTDLLDAIQTWVGSICEERVKLVAAACVQPKAEDRPMMKDVYLHLAGALVIDEKHSVEPAVSAAEVQPNEEYNSPQQQVSSDSVVEVCATKRRRVTPSDESHYIAGKDWKKLRKLKSDKNSKSVKIYVFNNTEGAMELCRVQTDGQLYSELRVEGGTSGRLTKKRRDGGVFFVLRDEGTHAFRLAFAAKSVGRRVIVGPNYALFEGFEEHLHLANQSDVSWPLRSLRSLRTYEQEFSLTLENEMDGLRVDQLDDSGCEVPAMPLIHKFGASTHAKCLASSGSVFVFRGDLPGFSPWHEVFLCAVCVPLSSHSFTIRLDSDNNDHHESSSADDDEDDDDYVPSSKRGSTSSSRIYVTRK